MEGIKTQTGDNRMSDFEKKEQLVDHYITSNNTEEAVRLLYELIITSAKAQAIMKAEALREKLLEVAPLALTEITKSADIIEEEKTKLMDQSHLKAWAALYDTLTTEETHALFFATKQAEFKKGDTVFEQGEKNNRLYLIDKGNLRMVYQIKGQVFLVKKLSPGDFAGDDTFFSTTVSNSVSLLTESDVKLRILGNEVLKEWGTRYPGLTPKLLDHCLKAGIIHDVIKDMKIDRRSQKRIDMSGIGQFQFIKKTGENLGAPFKGSLSDISLGGLCFIMRISKRETARLLLGRKIGIKIQSPKDPNPIIIELVGTIIGVREDNFQDYSIHTIFDKELDENTLKTIEAGVKN